MDLHVDITAKDEGTIWILASGTRLGRDWLADNLDPEAQRWPTGLGAGYVVEHRYVQDIVVGATDAGLIVREG